MPVAPPRGRRARAFVGPEGWKTLLSLGIALLFVCPSNALAGSTLYFPKLDTQPESLTGIAIVNPSSQDAVVTVTAYGSTGEPIAAPGLRNPAVRTVKANQQLAILASQLFEALPDPGVVAWFQATSTADGLTGFYLLLDTSIRYLDGADLPAPSKKIVFQQIRVDGGYSTEIDVINPGGTTAEVQAELFVPGGIPMARVWTIPPRGMSRIDALSLFELTRLPAGAYAIVQADVEIVGVELVRSPLGEILALNGRRWSEQWSALVFPQLAVAGAYKTELGVVNHGEQPVILTITAYKPSGVLYDAPDLRTNPVLRTLGSKESLQEDLEQMFGFAGDDVRDGWVQVKSTAATVNGYLSYGIPSSGAVAAVSTAGQGRTRALFAHIATVDPYFTGLAVLNPGTLSANVRIVALSPTGEPIGSFDTVVQPGHRITRLLGTSGFIPEAANHSGGILWVKSDLPLHVASIFGSEQVFASVPAQDAPASYAPDAALTALKMKPPLAILRPKQTQEFRAEGASGGIDWKVNGSPGGEPSSGTISAAGMFTAPASVPARQVVTITAEASKQSAGASVDILDKNAFVSDLRIVQSVAYLHTLGRVYAAELTALSGFSAPSVRRAAPASGNSQIVEIAATGVRTAVATYNNENISKIIPFKAADAGEYLLLAALTSGRIIRLNPATRQAREVASGLNEPSALVLDPSSGDLLVAEKDKITTVARAALESGLTATPSAPAARMLTTSLERFPGATTLAASAAGGLAFDRCTGRIYFTVPSGGTLVEYDGKTGAFRTVVQGLQNPGALLSLYRTGVSCPDAFHLIVAETGANRTLLVLPRDGSMREWVPSPGVHDLFFLPAENPYTPNEAVFLGENSATSGALSLVPLAKLYDSGPANAPEPTFVEIRADMSASMTASPEPVVSLGQLTYSIELTNRGPSEATGVVLTDKLPAEVTFVSATPSQGRCELQGGSVNCAIGKLSVSAKAVVTLKVLVSFATATRTITNTVITGANEIDPDVSNNSVTVKTTSLPARIAKLEIRGLPDPYTAGTSSSVTVTARDSSGNVATGYLGIVRFTSTDHSAILPANTTFKDADAGVKTFLAGVVLQSLGDQTVTVTDTQAAALTASQSVKVTAAAATSLQVSGIPDRVTSGKASSVAVTARNASGGVASGYSGTVRFSSTDPAATLPSTYTFTAADAGAHTFIDGVTLRTAGSQTLTATDSISPAITGKQTVVVVGAGAAARITLSGIPATVGAGKAASVTVTIEDASGNTVEDYLGTVRFTASDSAASLPADYTFTAADAGAHTFTSGIILRTEGTQTVTVSDRSNPSIAASASVKVVSDSAARLELSGIAGTLEAGAPASPTVTARDDSGNVLGSYTGTARFTSTDPAASLPGPYNFTAADGGSHTFMNAVVLRTAGTQTITAIDSASAAASGSASVTVKAGAARKLELTGLPAAVTSGAPSSFTVRAVDAHGNTARAYGGTVRFTSSDSAAALPSDHAFTLADAGSRTFSATFKTPGKQTLTAADSASASLRANETITVDAAAAAKIELSGLARTIGAGVRTTFTITAKDASGNVVPSYAGTMRITSSDKSAALPSDYRFKPGDAGIHEFDVTLRTAGNHTVTATDTADASLSATGGVTVTPGAASTLIVSGLADPTSAGELASVTVTVRDGLGNIASGYTGTVRFSSTDRNATLPGDTTFRSGDAGSHTFNRAVAFGTIGNQTLTVTDTGSPSLRGSQSVTVAAAAATQLAVSGLPSSISTGTAASLTVTAKDSAGNIDTAYTGTVHFTSTDPAASLPAATTFKKADAGVRTFTGVTLRTPGTQTVTVTDGKISGSQSVTVQAAAASKIEVTGLPSTAAAGTSLAATVTIRDSAGQIATDYTGTVRFTSTDSSAVLPSDTKFKKTDGGVATFTGIILKTPGPQTITVTDTSSPSITGSQSLTVTGSAAKTIEMTGLSGTTGAGVPRSVTVTLRDASGSVATGYTGTLHFSSSDRNATLPGDTTFTASDAGSRSFTDGIILRSHGRQTITATDAANASLSATASVTVTPAPSSSVAVVELAPPALHPRFEWKSGVEAAILGRTRDNPSP